MSLNPRQEKFCQLFVDKGNATHCYIEAGYKPRNEACAESSASRLLSIVKIAKRVEEIRKEAADAFEVTRLDQLKFFRDIAVDGGEETRDRIAAGKEINKMLGYYEPEKIEHSADDALTKVLKSVTGNVK